MAKFIMTECIKCDGTGLVSIHQNDLQYVRCDSCGGIGAVKSKPFIRRRIISNKTVLIIDPNIPQDLRHTMTYSEFLERYK